MYSRCFSAPFPDSLIRRLGRHPGHACSVGLAVVCIGKLLAQKIYELVRRGNSSLRILGLYLFCMHPYAMVKS